MKSQVNLNYPKTKNRLLSYMTSHIIWISGICNDEMVNRIIESEAENVEDIK